VSALKEDLEKALEAISVLSQIADHRFEAVDDQVVHLRGSMGSRPHMVGSKLPALDLWTNMANIANKVNDAKTREPPKPSHYEVATRSLADASNKMLQKHAASINNLANSKAEYMGQVRPMETALDHVVKDLYEPEGSYNKVLMEGFLTGNGNDASLNLQTKIEALAGQVDGLTGSALGGVSGALNDPELFALKSEVAQLKSDNQTIKASLGGEVVKIENEAFHSAEEVKSWIVDCVGPAAGTFEFFFDVTSMLESLQDAGRTSDEYMDSQALSRKANHRSVSAARMLNSFSASVPQVMNKKNSQEYFSLIPSYEKWRSNNGRTGMVESIRKNLQLWESRTDSLLTNRFSMSSRKDVLLLARNLMRKSMSFWVALCNWIDEFYTKLTAKTEAQKPGSDASLAERREYNSTLASVREEAWRLVIDVLTDIFQELALRRAEGQAASELTDDPSMQSALVLYSTLKAHKFMSELVERRFERHPVMAHTFNGFLFSERASHGDIKRLEIKMAENNVLTRTLQSKVDKKS
jgi:hypothetical protein